MRTLVPAEIAALGLVACASTSTRIDDPLDALRFAETRPVHPGQVPDTGHANAFEIELSVADEVGRVLARSRLTGGPGRLVTASNVRRFPFVDDYEFGWNGFPPPRPVLHFVEVGMRIVVCVQCDAEGHLSIRWRAGISKLNAPVADFCTTLANGPPVRIQSPEITVTTAEGSNPVEPGAATSLGHIQRPDGSGSLHISACIVSALVDTSEIGAFEVAPAAIVSVDDDWSR